ncbi:MAG: DNA replication/repair protein RecF [Alphaproteobacteria bacterium]|nr:DNA replication/repair protein RecF [Nevskiaceae bacterium]MBV9063455.1 DNA replication/repair protein RecF [Alphaproteobacteria bacterium]
MTVHELSLANVRCIEEAELEFGPGLTLIHGDNGSGKTSILEAIFLLGRGRSFRTRNSERLIRRGAEMLRVVGTVSGGSGDRRTVGIEVRAGSVAARLAGNPVESLAELSQVFPVQIIEPGVHRLIEEGGHRRRRWMDWAVFHVEPYFADTWTRYTRAVRQRNAALRADPSHASVWDPEISRLGEEIARARGRSMEALQPHWEEAVAELSGLPVQLHYLRGWGADLSLAEALRASEARDALRKMTHAGPHRADVSVRLLGRPAREVLSRGQQKLVAVAMTVAQLRLLQAQAGTMPTLLLDDPAAELDGEKLTRFIGQVKQLRSQLIMTSLSPGSRLFGAPERTFRVDQGRVQPV